MKPEIASRPLIFNRLQLALCWQRTLLDLGAGGWLRWWSRCGRLRTGFNDKLNGSERLGQPGRSFCFGVAAA